VLKFKIITTGEKMRTRPAFFFIMFFCATTPFGKVAFGASKVPISEIKAIACFFENKETGQKDEIDRMVFTGIGGLWALDDKCKKTAGEHARQKELTDWRHLCCPVTNNDIVHCESPLGNHGKW
jgi:hypothetical protein